MTITAPPDWAIALAEQAAAESPCAKSKRGVALYYCAPPVTRSVFGVGFNGPPLNAPCPGREVCGDNCGRLCVHAEMRAIRGVQPHAGRDLHLVHVKLGADDRVTAGGPPSCWQCSREILDVAFVTGVWLLERDDVQLPSVTVYGAAWRYYTAEAFHRATLRNAGLEQ